MADKPAFSPMMPAPRPRRINDPADTQALQDATRDLGFGRPTSEGNVAVEPKALETAAPPAVSATSAAVTAKPSAPAKVEKPAARPKIAIPDAPVVAAGELAALKFDIDKGLSNFLKMEAVRRGATVKFLILEALAGKGYPVDMANTPEDGRRPRRDA